MTIQDQIEINGKFYPVSREATPEEAEMLANQQEEPTEPTAEERLAALESAMLDLILGGA